MAIVVMLGNPRLDIYWDDYTPEAQKEILHFYKIQDPKEMNWDLMPVDSLYPDEDDPYEGH